MFNTHQREQKKEVAFLAYKGNTNNPKFLGTSPTPPPTSCQPYKLSSEIKCHCGNVGTNRSKSKVVFVGSCIAQ